MKHNYHAGGDAFGWNVRAFLDQALPGRHCAKRKGFRHLDKEDHQRWQQILCKTRLVRHALGQKSNGRCWKWTPRSKSNIWDEDPAS